jgi:competence CoiA-like predicted nuclease
MKDTALVSTSSESYYHKAIKQLIYDYIYENTNTISIRAIEKYFGNRFADVYFKLKSGEEIVVEIQNSKISVNEIIQRSNDYNHLGIYVLWLIHGEGNCVASKKYPRHSKEQKISPSEKFLHKMYGGRVYYVNLNVQENKIGLNKPFALHFSKVIKKKKRGIFKSGYNTYFYRDINFRLIPNWNMFCTKFSGFKIARFYDKNIKLTLKKKMEAFIVTRRKNSITKKKHLKSIIKRFNEKYGEFMIYNILIDLVNEQKINLGYNIFKKIKKKIID